MLNFNTHCKAIIVESFRPKFTRVVHLNGLDAVVRETCFQSDYLRNEFGESMVSSGQQVHMAPPSGRINQYHEVPKWARQGLNRSTNVTLNPL